MGNTKGKSDWFVILSCNTWVVICLRILNFVIQQQLCFSFVVLLALHVIFYIITEYYADLMTSVFRKSLRNFKATWEQDGI